MSDFQSASRLLPAGHLLVTGATGFLGGVLVRRLLANGFALDRLRCVVRDVERAARGGLPNECLVVGDLSSPKCYEQLKTAVEGVTGVVHLAGSLQAYDRRGFDDVNVHGTRQLYQAVAEAAPAAHIIHVSSLAAAGPSVDGASSADPADRCHPVSAYGESKRQGELLATASGLPYTILRPPVVYGPGDGATRLLIQQAVAPVTAVPRRPRPLSVIHADDVAEALWLAVLQRPTAAVLPLDGPERTDTHDLMRTIATACGRSTRLLPVPMVLAGLAASACDLLARLRHKPGYFNRDKVREIRAVGWVADGERARRVLGFVPQRGLLAGLTEVAGTEGFARGGARSASAVGPANADR